MNITISGLGGSGKTTVARLLAKKLALHRVSAGEIFREIAREKNMSLLEFSKYAETHPEIDRTIDERMARYGKEDGVILEGRLTGWVAARHGLPALKVWLNAALPVRAKRIAKRDKQLYQVALEQIERREESERQRYWDLYGIHLGDLSVYSLTISTDNLSPNKIVDRIVKRYKEL